MKIVSWNVNGLRACLKKGFLESVGQEQPDILCIQETKARDVDVDEHPDGYEAYWNSAEKKGYSGTLVYTRVPPRSVALGMDVAKHDREGRLVTLEYDDFYLVNVYTPNSQNELARLKYRLQWDRAFLAYLKRLEASKPVVFCGDLNVAHEEIDLSNPKSNRRNAGFTDEERASFSALLDAGFVDSFRALYPDKTEQYSWWSYRTNCRARNIGWRIDYVGLSASLRDRLQTAFILPQYEGSDHCPVGVTLS